MLYSIQCLMHKVGLLGKPGAEPGEVDKGAASDRTDGQVTEHGSGPTSRCRGIVQLYDTYAGPLPDHFIRPSHLVVSD